MYDPSSGKCVGTLCGVLENEGKWAHMKPLSKVASKKAATAVPSRPLARQFSWPNAGSLRQKHVVASRSPPGLLQGRSRTSALAATESKPAKTQAMAMEWPAPSAKGLAEDKAREIEMNSLSWPGAFVA